MKDTLKTLKKILFFQVTKAVGCWVTLTFAYGFKHLVTAVKIENRKEPGKTSAFCPRDENVIRLIASVNWAFFVTGKLPTSFPPQALEDFQRCQSP